MCGIIAVVQNTGRPFDQQALRRMLFAINHRGPDAEGLKVEGPVAIGNKRLSIIDEHSGNQPITIDGVSIVYNGEVYNYIELREELIQQGHQFRTACDTEVVLRAYLHFGPEFVNRLNGMFSFAIHDTRNGILLLARDRFGMKPLYFYRNQDTLIFASEIKSILQHPDVVVEADPDSVREYLLFQFSLGENTLFKGIYKILPGQYCVVDVPTRQMTIAHYYQPSFELDREHDEDYFLEKLRFLLQDSVRIHLRSDAPVGTFLSGGIDSSVITSLASKVTSLPLQSFTGRFAEGPEYDETSYARMVADHCGIANHVAVPTERDLIDSLPQLVWHMDEPAAGPGVFAQYIVARLARDKVKVVLGGQGGDEIFGGYARYLLVATEQALKAQWNGNGHGHGHHAHDHHSHQLKAALQALPELKQYHPMIDTFLQNGVSEPVENRYFRLLDRSRGMRELYASDFFLPEHREESFGRYSRIFNRPDTDSCSNRMTYFDLTTSLPALLHVDDRVSMSVSLESRLPFLDYRIVDLLFTIPPALRWKEGKLKYLLRRTASGLIPDDVLNRKDKMGFPVPLQVWSRGEYGDFMRSMLLSARCRTRGLFNSQEVEKLLEKEQAYGRSLWGLLNLELWYRQFIDSAAVKDESQCLSQYTTVMSNPGRSEKSVSLAPASSESPWQLSSQTQELQ